MTKSIQLKMRERCPCLIWWKWNNINSCCAFCEASSNGILYNDLIMWWTMTLSFFQSKTWPTCTSVKKKVVFWLVTSRMDLTQCARSTQQANDAHVQKECHLVSFESIQSRSEQTRQEVKGRMKSIWHCKQGRCDVTEVWLQTAFERRRSRQASLWSPPANIW